MRASHLFMIALLVCILSVVLTGREQKEERDGITDGLQAAKAYVPRSAEMAWTEDGTLNFSLHFPPPSRAPQPIRKPDADASESESQKAEANPYDRVPD